MTERESEFRQYSLHRLAFGGGERGLRRDRIADVVALDLQAGLDACREIEAREGLVDLPELALELHRLVPFLSVAQFVELHALLRHDAGRAGHPADTADQHHRCRDMRRR